MRVRSAVRRMCRDCYVVKKKRVVYIRCKSVKKHKQRQGFHTDAGVPAWQGGAGDGSYAHGFGSCPCCEDAIVPSLGSASRVSTDGASGILASLPWLPAWASVAGATGRTGISQAAASAVAPLNGRAGEGSGSSALKMLGGWMKASALGRGWWNRR